MEKVACLTVQDFLWIGLEVNKRPVKYSYAALEEGVYAQYSYGSSVDVAGQALRLLTEFRRLAPLESGNDAAAFIGFLAFLKINHHSFTLSPDEAAAWAKGVWASPEPARADVESRMHHSDNHGRHGLSPARQAVAHILAEYGPVIQTLLDEEPERALARS